MRCSILVCSTPVEIYGLREAYLIGNPIKRLFVRRYRFLSHCSESVNSRFMLTVSLNSSTPII